MKKKIVSMLLLISILIGLTGCFSDGGTITKVSEEVEYTKIENDVMKVYNDVSKGCVGLAVTGQSKSATGSGLQAQGPPPTTRFLSSFLSRLRSGILASESIYKTLVYESSY